MRRRHRLHRGEPTSKKLSQHSAITSGEAGACPEGQSGLLGQEGQGIDLREAPTH